MMLGLGATEILSLRTYWPRPMVIKSIADVPELLIGWSQYHKQTIEGNTVLNTAEDRVTFRKRYKAIVPTAPLAMPLFDFDYRGQDRAELMRAGYEIARRALG
jgi:hypothetical protein